MASPQDSLQFHSLSAGRALAAVYVVLFHADVIAGDKLGLSLSGAPLTALLVKAGHSGVAFFFVLSGFIILIAHRTDIGRAQRLPRYARNRLIRIYPTFWAALGLFVLGQYATQGIDPQLHSLRDVLRALLLLPFPGLPPMTVAWTLSHEMLFYLLFALLLPLPRLGCMVLTLWLGLCAITGLASGLGGVTPVFPARFLLSPYNVLFGFGMLTALLVLKTLRNPHFGRHFGPGWSRRLPKAALTVGGIGYLAMIAMDAQLSQEAQILGYGLSSMLLIFGATRLELAGRLPVPGWLRLLGEASYAIYLTHPMAIIAATIVLRALHLHELPAMLWLPLLTLSGILGGLLFHLLVEKPLRAALRRRKGPVPDLKPAAGFRPDLQVRSSGPDQARRSGPNGSGRSGRRPRTQS